jgi:hypothetical protein
MVELEGQCAMSIEASMISNLRVWVRLSPPLSDG